MKAKTEGRYQQHQKFVEKKKNVLLEKTRIRDDGWGAEN